MEGIMQVKRLVCCACSDYNRVDKSKINELVSRARLSGLEVELIPDLCLRAVNNPTQFKEYSSKDTLIALCHLRVAQAFFARVDAEVPEVIGFNDKNHVDKIKSFKLADGELSIDSQLPEYQNDWVAWYPVIDKNRCNNCGKCIDFCLFGVYSKKDQKIVVTQPTECKTNCPACSRVCPQQAIIFPKHDEEPFNGALVTKDTSGSKKELDAETEDELYQKLVSRRRKRKSSKLLKD